MYGRNFANISRIQDGTGRRAIVTTRDKRLGRRPARRIADGVRRTHGKSDVAVVIDRALQWKEENEREEVAWLSWAKPGPWVW